MPSGRVTGARIGRPPRSGSRLRCTACQRWRLRKFFTHYPKKGRRYWRSRCESCIQAGQRVYRGTETFRAKHRAYYQKRKTDVRFVAGRRLNNYRKHAAGCTLTSDDLVRLYDTQKGKCYYTGRIMQTGHDRVRPDSLSLDRLVPSRGYRKGNVVWCCNLVNTMKQQMTEQEFYRFLRHILRHREKEV